MLVKNVSGVELRCNDFGIRPFAMVPGEVKEIPDVVATRWLAMHEKPVIVFSLPVDPDPVAEIFTEDDEEPEEVEKVEEAEAVEEDEEVTVEQEDTAPRKRNRR